LRRASPSRNTLHRNSKRRVFRKHPKQILPQPRRKKVRGRKKFAHQKTKQANTLLLLLLLLFLFLLFLLLLLMSSEEESSPPRDSNANGSCPGAPRKKVRGPLRNHLGIAPKKLFGDSPKDDDDDRTLPKEHLHRARHPTAAAAVAGSDDGHGKQPDSQHGK